MRLESGVDLLYIWQVFQKSGIIEENRVEKRRKNRGKSNGNSRKQRKNLPKLSVTGNNNCWKMCNLC
jgi:hypothetical protein